MKLFERKRDNDTRQSARPMYGTAKTVAGIKVQKLPIGRYFEVIDRLNGIIFEIVNAIFPGATVDKLLKEARSMTNEKLKELLLTALGVVPNKLLKIISELLGIDESELLALYPADAAQVLETFIQLNDYTDFFAAAQRISLLIRNNKAGTASAR